MPWVKQCCVSTWAEIPDRYKLSKRFGYPDHPYIAVDKMDKEVDDRIKTDAHIDLINSIKSINKSQISILDAGGRTPHTYFVVKKMCPDINIDYYIVDLPTTIDVCNSYYSLDNLTVQHNYDNIPKIDILHLDGFCQYLEDINEFWDNVLKLISPKFILVTRTVLVERANDHLRLQTYRERYIPYWFYNKDKFINNVLSHNYQLRKCEDNGEMLNLFSERPNYGNELYTLIFKQNESV